MAASLLALAKSIYYVQAPTVSCLVTQFARKSFGISCFRGSCMREIDVINPRVSKITVTHAVCT